MSTPTSRFRERLARHVERYAETLALATALRVTDGTFDRQVLQDEVELLLNGLVDTLTKREV